MRVQDLTLSYPLRKFLMSSVLRVNVWIFNAAGNACLFKNSFNGVFKMLQLHCDLFEKKSTFWANSKFREFLHFNHFYFYKIKLSLCWILIGLAYLNYISNNIVQTVFKSQRIYIIQFIGKYLINHTLFWSLLRIGCGC